MSRGSPRGGPFSAEVERIEKRKRTQTIVFSKMEEEIRIAVIDNGHLDEVFFEELDNDSVTGNIYLGKVENVVPSLEAAFVDIGVGRNAFLRFKDAPNRSKLGKGSKVLVQVKKDAIGTKGPQVTLKVSIPGRSVVYTPFSKHVGVSKKIAEAAERDRLYKVAKSALSEKEGVIFRTAAYGVGDENIRDEIERLRNKWKEVNDSFKRGRKPKILYEESSLVEYILRERLTENTAEIVVDTEDLWHDVVAGVSKFKSGFKPVVRFVEGDSFITEGAYEKIKEIYKRIIPLESGGNVVIDRTEAMTVIDVNSASNVSGGDVAETSLVTNLEAASQIARHLRLRNIGGIIVIDFIDMKTDEDRTKVVNAFTEELKKDKAKSFVLGFTKLGLLEMTRRRSTAAIGTKLFISCPVCKGTGDIESPRVTFQRLVRDLGKLFEDKSIKRANVQVFHNLSGVLTPEVQKKLTKTFKRTLSFTFTWPIPASFEIKGSKKNGQE